MVTGRLGITISPYQVRSIYLSNFASPGYMKPLLLSDFSNPRDIKQLISLGDIENLEDDMVDVLVTRPKKPATLHDLDYWPQYLPSEYYYLYVDSTYLVQDPMSKFNRYGWWICRIENEEPWYFLKDYFSF